MKKIKDVCSRFSSGNFISVEKISSSGKFPVFGGNGLRGYAENFNFDGECAIIGRQGAYCGNVKFFSGKAHMTEHAIVAVANEKNYTKFLAYKFSLMNFRKYASQSAQPGLSAEFISNLEIDLPPLEIQKQIGNFLYSLDEKISLNKKINATLEEMAKTIYLHKFFRKTANRKISNILIENPKSAISVGDAKNSSGDFPFFTSGENILRWNEKIVDGRNIFLNTGGNAGVKFYVGAAAYSTDTWSIYAKNNLSDYFYLLLKIFETELNKKFFQGTGLKHLQKDLLKDFAIYIPTDEELKNFNSAVQPCFDMISKNFRENNLLEKLRDFLLPMLMNGQVKFCQ